LAKREKGEAIMGMESIGLIGWLLIIVAACVVAVMVWAVAQEKHEHEEYFDPNTVQEAAPQADDSARGEVG
jgi:hypothetical protein